MAAFRQGEYCSGFRGLRNYIWLYAGLSALRLGDLGGWDYPVVGHTARTIGTIAA